MSSIIVQGVSNANLPLAGTYSQRIAALGSCQMWAQGDAAHVTIASSAISEFNNVLGGSAKMVATADRRATLSAAQLAGFSVAQMRGTDTEATAANRTIYTASGWSAVENDPYTIAAVFRPSDNTTSDIIIGRFTDGSNRVNAQITGAGNMNLSHGSTTISLPVTMNQWNYMIVSYDGTNVILNVNGSETAPTAPTGGTGSSQWIIGSLGASTTANVYDGQISDVLFFDDGLLFTESKKAALVGLFEDVYGL